MALLSLALAMLLSSLGTSIANVGLPALTRAFHASFQAVQWIVLAYLLANTTLLVSAGRLGDVIGRRRLLLAGVTLFTLASVMCALAPTLGLLVAARAVQGLGGAIMMALAIAMVADTVPKAETGRAMGLLGTMSAIGTALGPSMGGLLLAAFDWRAIFLINLPLGILTLVLAHRSLSADRPSPVTGALVIRLSVLRDPALGASLVMSVLVSTVVMATLVVGPFYLSRALGLAAAWVGLAMSVGPVVAAIAGIPSGRAVDKLGARRVTLVGLGGLAAGAILLATLPAALGLAGYVGPLVIITSGYALFQTANNTAVMTDVRPDQRGVISGLLSLSRNLGLIAGASIMGAVFAFGSATADVATAAPDAVAAGMRLTFAAAAFLIAVALAIAAAMIRSQPCPATALHP
jgi:MFS family permease